MFVRKLLRCRWPWVAMVAIVMAVLVPGCKREKEPPVSTAPTAENPKPFPGMEEARGKATLVLPRGGDETNK